MTHPRQSDTPNRLIRLMDVTVTRPGEEPWVLARNSPVAVDVEGRFVDLGESLRESFGGGFQVTDGTELELAFRWKPAYVEDEDDVEDEDE